MASLGDGICNLHDNRLEPTAKPLYLDAAHEIAVVKYEAETFLSYISLGIHSVKPVIFANSLPFIVTIAFVAPANSTSALGSISSMAMYTVHPDDMIQISLQSSYAHIFYMVTRSYAKLPSNTH